jgi:general secretion pathway protein K
MGPWPRQAGQRGIALVAVLWALVLLALIAATVLGESRSASRLARNLTDAARAEALADGGVHRALAGLAAPAAEGGWRADGTVYAWLRPMGEVRIRIEDEGGKVDLNRAGGPLFRRLFLGAGLDTERAEVLTDAVLDYRDADHLRRPRGAEDGDYRAAGLPFGAKDAPFDAPEELAQILGMDRETYAAVIGAVTVHSGLRRPDPGAAPALVRGALGMEEGRPPSGSPASGAGSPPETADPALGVLARGPTAYRSPVRVYTIHAEARTSAGARFARHCVVRMTGTEAVPYRILAWGRGEARLFEDGAP